MILVYDVTNRESFEHIKMWLEEANSLCTPGGSRIIVGTKADAEEKRQVPWDAARRLSQELGAPIIETSAWSIRNVNNAFALAVKCEVQRRKHTPLLPEVPLVPPDEDGAGEGDDEGESTGDSAEDQTQ